MNYGIKVFKKDVESLKNQNKKSRRVYNKENAHILIALALPYLRGARLQVERYQEASLSLKKDSINATNNCLHEMSCLFEDLNTVAYYVKLCGKKHRLNRVFREVRNHIRHDIRDNFDSDCEKRDKRWKYLGIDEQYQTQMGFSYEGIKIGSTFIEIRDINQYLDWVTNIVNSAINEAWKKGKIKMNSGKKQVKIVPMKKSKI